MHKILYIPKLKSFATLMTIAYEPQLQPADTDGKSKFFGEYSVRTYVFHMIKNICHDFM